MNKQEKRKWKLINSTVEALCEETEKDLEVFFQERPFLEDKTIEKPIITLLNHQEIEARQKRLLEILAKLVNNEPINDEFTASDEIDINF